MAFTPLDRLPDADRWRAEIALVATDVDGTLTRDGRFSADLLRSLDRLAAAGIPVLATTGRSAGWVQGLATYLPLAGAIAENGGIFYTPEGDSLRLSATSAETLGDSPPETLRERAALAETFARLQAEFPHLRESVDNPFRITDWTFDRGDLSPAQLDVLADRCRDWGWGFTYSSIQAHIKPPDQDKGRGLAALLSQRYPHLSGDRVLTVGDSPNDASLFDPARFPRSAGVANVLAYRDVLPFAPAIATSRSEGDGFCELADWLLVGRG